MSSMLEQAIIDATALREAALKNAEQALIEKYAPEIKEAVNKMLEDSVNENLGKERVVKHEGRFARVTTESEDGKVGIQYVGENKTNLVLESELEEADEALLQEEEAAMAGGAPTQAAPTPMDSIPLATGDTPEGDVNLSMNYFEFDPNDFDVDLQDAFLADDQEQTQEPQAAAEATPETPEEQAPEGEGAEEEGAGLLVGDEELESAAEGGESLLEEDLISEIAKILDEELVVDMGETKQGHITTDEGTLKYEQEKELASEEDDEEKEKEEEYKKKIEELDEAIAKVTKQNKQFLNIINELNETLNETLLSNAKLLYSNKTLSDASLNERQKIKIVEAIAKANTPEEAKNLQEALKTTVGSTKSQGPKSLSESVQRRSNLSNVLPRRKQPDNQQFSFAEHMKKLAGIK